MKKGLEQLLEESNRLRNIIEAETMKLREEELRCKVNDKTWSILEVIDHLNKVYDIYIPNIKKALESAEDADGYFDPKYSIMGRLSVYSMKPKNTKRRFKMKTFKFFEPSVDQTDYDVLQTFMMNKSKFNDLIRLARTKDLRKLKITSALGERVKFYTNECFDFILAHEERHVVQLKSIKASLPS